MSPIRELAKRLCEAQPCGNRPKRWGACAEHFCQAEEQMYPRDLRVWSTVDDITFTINCGGASPPEARTP